MLAAGVGQNPARQASIKAGLSHMIPAMTINKVCGSGLKAVRLAAQSVANGDSDLVVAGGQENMSAAPHLLNGARDGFRMGDAKMIENYKLHLRKVDAIFRDKPNVRWLDVSYNDVVREPRKPAEAVARFVGSGLDVDKMVSAVDAALYRNRAG